MALQVMRSPIPTRKQMFISSSRLPVRYVPPEGKPIPPSKSQRRHPIVSQLATTENQTNASLRKATAKCSHCGSSCGTKPLVREEESFCCAGCLAVFELLTENGLTDFYRLSDNAGVLVPQQTLATRFASLDEPVVRGRFVDCSDASLTRVTRAAWARSRRACLGPIATQPYRGPAWAGRCPVRGRS